MKIIELKNRENLTNNPKLKETYAQFKALLNELNNKNLPEHIILSINNDIEKLNSMIISNNFKRLILKKQTKIIKQIEKELKIVPKNYYRNLWMVFGMTAFGLPIGIAIGLSIGNIGLLAIGLPIGMVVGIGAGLSMDEKAFKEGRQLNFEMQIGFRK